MAKKIIALNVRETPNEQVLRDDIISACDGEYSVDFIDSNDLWLDIKTGSVKIMSLSGELKITDVFVFVRARKKDSAFVALLCHIFKLSGVKFSDAGNESHSDFTDKSFAIPRLAFHGLPVPNSVVISYASLQQNVEYVENNFAYPCVVKGNGACGRDVTIVNNRKELLDFSEVVNKKPTLITIQELIVNTYDVRALFISSEYLGSIRRTRSESEPLLNNVSQGASVAEDKLSELEIEICKQAVKVSYLDFCGVDFIRTEKGIVFLELNKTPQLGGIRSVLTDLSVGSGLLSLVREK